MNYYFLARQCRQLCQRHRNVRAGHQGLVRRGRRDSGFGTSAYVSPASAAAGCSVVGATAGSGERHTGTLAKRRSGRVSAADIAQCHWPKGIIGTNDLRSRVRSQSRTADGGALTCSYSASARIAEKSVSAESA